MPGPVSSCLIACLLLATRAISISSEMAPGMEESLSEECAASPGEDPRTEGGCAWNALQVQAKRRQQGKTESEAVERAKPALRNEGATGAAFLVIDTQNCFLEAQCTTSGKEGTLAVPGCDIIPKINQIRAEKSCLFDEVVFSRDFHPKNHISWASTHGLEPFDHLGGLGGLPITCISPTSGLIDDAACCPEYYLNPDMDCTTQLCPPPGWNYTVNNSEFVANNPACSVCAETPHLCFNTTQAMWTDHCWKLGDSTFPVTLDKRPTDPVFKKGQNEFVDAYSAFMDNTKTLVTPLNSALQSAGIKTLYVAGIATDYCVEWTVLDALGNKTGDYDVFVISDATQSVGGDEDNKEAGLKTMAEAGAKIVTTEDILAMQC